MWRIRVSRSAPSDGRQARPETGTPPRPAYRRRSAPGRISSGFPRRRTDRLSTAPAGKGGPDGTSHDRSEEHTSELQSLMRISYAVFCLKKKKKNDKRISTRITNITTR